MESNVYNNQKPMESNQNNGSIKMQCSVMNGLLVYCVVMVFEVHYVLGINATWQQIGFDINGEAADDQSGLSVSLSSDGTILAVGAILNAGNGTNAYAGHVRVHQYNGAIWQQIGNDIDGEAAGDYSGTSISLSSNGTILAVSAPYNDGIGDSAGHVRVYQYNGAIWHQIGNDIDGEAAEDYSGTSVSLSSDGTILAVSAYGNDGTGDNAGHVRVHLFNGAIWEQIGNDIDGEAAGDHSGGSISLSSDGTILAVSAPYNDGTGTDAGHVRVYQYNGATWQQIGSDIDGEAAGDWSGHSISLSSDGTILAVGAYGNDGVGDNAGHVLVYKYNGAMWKQIGNDIDGEAAIDFSGFSVSLSSDGTILAVGAMGNDGMGDNVGHVRVHRYNGAVWQQIGNDIHGEAAGDGSGGSVSLSSDGTILAVGAMGNDGMGDRSGHVRCFNLFTASPTSSSTFSPTSAPTSQTILPSNAPTLNPIVTPIQNLTVSPTFSPSQAPTRIPTRLILENVTTVPSEKEQKSFVVFYLIGGILFCGFVFSAIVLYKYRNDNNKNNKNNNMKVQLASSKQTPANQEMIEMIEMMKQLQHQQEKMMQQQRKIMYSIGLNENDECNGGKGTGHISFDVNEKNDVVEEKLNDELSNSL